MTDYIKEFGDDQKKKKINIQFEPDVHEPEIFLKHAPHPQAVKHADDLHDKTKNLFSKDKHSQNEESTISEKQLEGMVTEAILNFMNEPELIQEQKIEENPSIGSESSEEYLNQLKREVIAVHKEADARYNEVAHQMTDYMRSNPFEKFTSSRPDAQEGHRMALADGQYKVLKKKAMDLESKLRILEKRLKNKK